MMAKDLALNFFLIIYLEVNLRRLIIRVVILHEDTYDNDIYHIQCTYLSNKFISQQLVEVYYSFFKYLNLWSWIEIIDNGIP